MSNYAHGHDAEKAAAEYLQRQDYTIIALNWRHKRAEIDIVARSPDGVPVFIEVKYRQTAANGSGFDYITSAKLKQMAFAAGLYVAAAHYNGTYLLGALEVSGSDNEITGFIPDIT